MARLIPKSLRGGTTTKRPSRRRDVFIGLLTIILIGLAAIWLLKPSLLSTRPETKAGEGTIEVKTNPEGAAAVLDGQGSKRKTNTSFAAPAGRHTVKLTLSGYDEQDVIVEVKAGQKSEIEHVFTKNGVTVVGKNGETFASDQLTTYRSEKFNYTISYPKDWLVETDPAGIPHFYNAANARRAKEQPGAELEESLVILALDNPKQLPPKAWYQGREEYAAEDQSQIKQEDATVNGKPAYRYETPYGFVPNVTTVLTRGNQAFLLQIKQGTPDRKIYDQMVNTFTLL